MAMTFAVYLVNSFLSGFDFDKLLTGRQSQPSGAQDENLPLQKEGH